MSRAAEQMAVGPGAGDFCIGYMCLDASTSSQKQGIMKSDIGFSGYFAKIMECSSYIAEIILRVTGIVYTSK